jgi:hypothetical protein
MTQLFLIHSDQDTDCAAQLQRDLAAQGYVIWQDTSGAPPDRTDALRAWQQGITDSRVVVVVWSAAAAQAASVAQRLDYAHQVYKQLLVVALDTTARPDALAAARTVNSTAPCTDAAAHLRAHLPPPDTGSAPGPSGAAGSASEHIFGVRCANGHITYFDKREVCRDTSTIVRTIYRDNRRVDKLRLRCGTCGEWMVVEVECEGYR